MTILTRLLREPLLHFMIIGVIIFASYNALNDTSEVAEDVIVIGPDRIGQLVAGYEAVWKRKPSDDQIEVLIDADIREEVYYREALALGLDQNDSVVRQRMGQKMDFLLDIGAFSLEPEEGELEAYFEAEKEFYKSGLRLAFEQIYLGSNPTNSAVETAIATLAANPDADPSAFAQRTLLPAGLGLSRPTAVDGVFGTGFFDKVAELEQGPWVGPVVSSYGVHMVRILDTIPEFTPPLEDIRDVVIRNWRQVKAKELRDKDYAERRKKFTVEINRGENLIAENE